MKVDTFDTRMEQIFDKVNNETEINTLFSTILENTQEELNKESSDTAEVRPRQELIDDIKSLLLTGFTKSELEYLEQLIREIEKLKNENNPNNEKTIKDLIKQLQQELIRLMKRVKGEATVDMDENNNSAKSNALMIGLKQGDFDSMKEVITKMKNGDFKQDTKIEQNLEQYEIKRIHILTEEFLKNRG